VIGALAVAAWLALVGSYVWVLYVADDDGRDLGSDVIITEGDSWMILTRDDQEVGYVHETRTPLDDGWLLEYDLMMNVSMLGASQILETSIQSRVDQAARLSSFTATIKTGATSFDVEGEVDGTIVEMSYDLGGGTKTRRIQLNEAPRLSNSAINQLIARDDLEPGTTFEQDYFDPTIMGMKKMKWEFVRRHEVDVFEEKIDTFHFRQKLAGTELDTYVDKNGEVYIQEFPLRIIGARMPKQLGRSRAQAMRRDFESGERKGADLSEGMAIDTQSALEMMRGTAGPLASKPTRFAIEGMTDDLQLVFDSGEQKVVDRAEGRIVVDTTEALPQSSLSDEERSLYLAATERVDHEEDAVRDFIANIDADRTAAQKVEELARRVAAAVKTEPEVGIKSASGIVADPRGDCTEHALLLAAGARAMGVPARFAHGVKRDDAGKFVPHVWVQYWDGSRFVDIDATTSTFQVGSGALQFFVSETPDDARVLGALEALDITPVTPEPDLELADDGGETFHK
jgi:hypothetical protein